VSVPRVTERHPSLADAIRLMEKVIAIAQRLLRVLGQAQAEEKPRTVFVYVNISKQVGDVDHIKVFATTDAAETWFEENDPEGVAFEYEVPE
jgi:hypothetical protein